MYRNRIEGEPLILQLTLPEDPIVALSMVKLLKEGTSRKIIEGPTGQLEVRQTFQGYLFDTIDMKGTRTFSLRFPGLASDEVTCKTSLRRDMATLLISVSTPDVPHGVWMDIPMEHNQVLHDRPIEVYHEFQAIRVSEAEAEAEKQLVDNFLKALLGYSPEILHKQ